jgi:hypothetical protein
MSCVPHELLVLSSALPLATVDLSCAARPLSPRLLPSRSRLVSLSQLPEELQREIILATLDPLIDRASIDERWTMLENQRRLHGLLLVCRVWLVSSSCLCRYPPCCRP